MGSIYNRGTDQKPNIWIKYRDPATGKTRRKAIGSSPPGLTARQATQWDRDLRTRAKRKLAEVEAGIPQDDNRDDPLFRDTAPAWGKKRKAQFASGGHNLGHVNNHLMSILADLRLSEITTGRCLDVIERCRRRKISGTTRRLVMMTLSRFMNDMRAEDRPWLQNPVSDLDKGIRQRELRSTHDPEETPFLQRKEDVRRVYLALPRRMRPAFAVGVFAGLRTGEGLALQWRDVYLDRRVIRLRRKKVSSKQKTGPLKNKRARTVPINNTLLPILRAWKLACPPGSLCFPASRTGEMMYDDTPHDVLKPILAKLELPPLTWYQATRHTFASHWVMDGGSIEELRRIMGHCSVLVTERYVHLAPDVFSDKAHHLACVDLTDGPGEVINLAAEATDLGTKLGTGAKAATGTDS